MSEMAPTAQAPTLEETRERLRRRRKRRKTTSCWPCRDRKVRCDNSHPCDTCSKRGHPDLCTYEVSTAATLPSHLRPDPHGHGNPVTPSDLGHVSPAPLLAQDFAQYEHPLAVDEAHVQVRKNAPTTATPQSTTCEPYLGENAIPSFVRDQSVADPIARTDVESGLMPILGLRESSSPYPFAPVVPNGMSMCESLPTTYDIIRLFQSFKTQLQTFTPILSDIGLFEKELCLFLDRRPLYEGTVENLENKVSPAWLSLLYAILASGMQFLDMPYDHRSKESSKYLRYSFKSLRQANFLMNPTIQCVETFLILGNVLQNMMKPEAAWILLGTTARLAQSLGLHQMNKKDGHDKRESILWLSVVWQDSLLSLCFDRQPTTTGALAVLADNSTSYTKRMNYTDAMCALLGPALKGIEIKSGATADFEKVLSIIDEIMQIHSRTEAHLQDSAQCQTIQQCCEHYALQLHTSFVAGWLSTRAFRRIRVSAAQEQHRHELATTGKRCFVRSLTSYLKLHPICIQASRSWAFIHNGLTSALLLGLLGETKVNPEVRRLQAALIEALDDNSHGENAQDVTNRRLVLSQLHGRALLALKSLYNEQTLRPQPIFTTQEVCDNVDGVASSRGVNMANDPMMMHSAVDATIHAGSTEQPETSGVAMTSEMSPMELFDSILWDPSFNADGLLDFDNDVELWMP